MSKKKPETSFSLGRKGEDAAFSYYEKKGFSLLEKNYLTPYGEIDLIIYNGVCIIFVEVKYRSSTHMGTPREFVSKNQQKRIREAASFFIAHVYETKNHDFSTDSAQYQFDVIEIIGKNMKIHHIPNAF